MLETDIGDMVEVEVDAGKREKKKETWVLCMSLTHTMGMYGLWCVVCGVWCLSAAGSSDIGRGEDVILILPPQWKMMREEMEWRGELWCVVEQCMHVCLVHDWGSRWCICECEKMMLFKNNVITRNVTMMAFLFVSISYE